MQCNKNDTAAISITWVQQFKEQINFTSWQKRTDTNDVCRLNLTQRSVNNTDWRTSLGYFETLHNPTIQHIIPEFLRIQFCMMMLFL